MKPCCCLVAARPPTSWLLSNTVTAFPASCSMCAAASPLHPAPIIAIDFNVLLFPGEFIARLQWRSSQRLPDRFEVPSYPLNTQTEICIQHYYTLKYRMIVMRWILGKMCPILRENFFGGCMDREVVY